MSVKPKDRKIAAVLALVSAIPMLPAGLHKFYLGQMKWGVVYLLLSWTPIPKFASAFEGLWYLFQDKEEFDQLFNGIVLGTFSQSETISSIAVSSVESTPMSTIAESLRQLEQLRQDGLVSDYEFEQKRRRLLDRIG